MTLKQEIQKLIKQYEKDSETMELNKMFDEQKRTNVAAVLREVIADLKRIVNN